MILVKKLKNVFDRTVDLLALVAEGIIGFVMIMVSMDVFMRYFLRRPITGVLEITEYSLLFITFFGHSPVVKKGETCKDGFGAGQVKPHKSVNCYWH